MGFRARSAFKLMQLEDEFAFLGDNSTRRVVDLCACPGSWSQVIERKLRGREGAVVVAVDVQPLRPLPGLSLSMCVCGHDQTHTHTHTSKGTDMNALYLLTGVRAQVCVLSFLRDPESAQKVTNPHQCRLSGCGRVGTEGAHNEV
jgi:hypothetical protein